ncbi:hypothetical protein [Rheinheimera texasensis]|uniref:hypothetical protein n=1 Tax=Rheinheimera texasensis TaxID=306205 RepID=UPI0004E266F0|nr:hypothetical protein [Rheinheimera texasensis]
MPTPYNMAFACLSCRKSFKREFNLAEENPKELKCPECGGIAHNFGRHFKAPKKNDLKLWQKITYLFEHGFRFQKICIKENSIETVPYPETLEAAKEFVVKYKNYAIK